MATNDGSVIFKITRGAGLPSQSNLPRVGECKLNAESFIFAEFSKLLGESAARHRPHTIKETEGETKNPVDPYFYDNRNYRAYIPLSKIDSCRMSIFERLNIYQRAVNDTPYIYKNGFDPRSTTFIGRAANNNELRLFSITHVDEYIGDWKDNNERRRITINEYELDAAGQQSTEAPKSSTVYRVKRLDMDPQQLEIDEIHVGVGQILEIYFEHSQDNIPLKKDTGQYWSHNVGTLGFIGHPAHRVERIKIVGRTDPTGKDSVNTPLSARRAKAVADYLKEKAPHLPITDQSVQGEGVTATGADDARKRRVDIEVTWNWDTADTPILNPRTVGDAQY